MQYFAALVLMGMLGGVAFGQGGAAAQPNGAAPATGQTDTQLLQAILVEMRGIRNEVRLSETTQILLTEMEVQRGVVDKALQKRDELRSRVSQLQLNAKNLAAQAAQMEQGSSATMDPVQQKRVADQEQMMKATLANFKSQEQDSANALADAESALRREQDTLGGIQAQLDDVVKKLQPAEK